MKISARPKSYARLLTGLLILGPLGGAAGAAMGAGADSAGTEHLRVSASIYPITMLVGAIGGERVSVTTVMPAGADPHHFELTPSGAKALYESRVVFLIGADFDSWLISMGSDRGRREPGSHGRAPADAARLYAGPEDLRLQQLARFELYKALSDSLIGLGDTFNPHFWLDPLLAKEMARQIGLTLIAADPSNRGYYEGRMARFAARMDSLHAAVKTRLEVCGFKAFVSFHPAWTYFARRYGLTEVAVVEKYPEHEPSAKWVANLISEIQRQRVEIMIVEAASDPAVVRGIANDTGVKVLTLDPVGDPDIPGRDTYSGLIDHNVSIVERVATGD